LTTKIVNVVYRLVIFELKSAGNKANNSSTLLDLFLSNLDCTRTVIIEQVCFSDHDSVQCNFEIYFEPPKDQFKWIRDYSDENWKTFNELLQIETWINVFSAPNVDTMCSNFMNKLIDYFEQSFPLKKIVIRANQVNKVKLSDATKELKTRVREFGEKLVLIMIKTENLN
jgi:hypothetical protein